MFFGLFQALSYLKDISLCTLFSWMGSAYNQAMAKPTFLNVPEGIAQKILEQPELHTESGYRGLYQKGSPKETDFLPTFVDRQQQRIREERRRCGPMAKSIVEKHKTAAPGDFAVSLFCSLERIKEVLWRDDSMKKDHPAIARGPTKSSRGYAVRGKDGHISYYLFDYEENNPCSDFVTVEEATFDE